MNSSHKRSVSLKDQKFTHTAPGSASLIKSPVLRLREDTAVLAARTMQLNQEKSKKQTTLLADPRALIKARVRGAPGARGPPARGPRNAVQRAADETRQLAIQRKQAMAVASKPRTKIDVAPKGLKDELRRSAQVIKAPAKKLGHKRALEDLLNETQDPAKKRSVSPPVAQPNGNEKSGEAVKSTASLPSATTTTTAKSAFPITPKKPVPARTGGIFANSKPLSMKGMPPVKTKQVTSNINGTVTITVSIDWTSPQNKQILESYTATEKAAALSKPATISTVPAAEYRKRGFNAISSDKAFSPSASTSTSATSPSADEDTHRPLAPSKRRKTAPSLFMPHKAVAKPRTQD